MELLYYIASLKHTSRKHEHISWWGKNHAGYTPVVGDYIGTYSHSEAMELNDGEDCIAVPVAVVQSVLSPEPYHRPGARFYDQVGPVVPNATAAWRVLIAGSNPKTTPKPRQFTGRRRSFAWKPTE
ncbi:hypothetical protein [Rhodoferax sp.]|uniref:hypothetical protein n=1 Tax=Rhodoferax sp. TaxID=50421 RepID=UPI00374CF595